MADATLAHDITKVQRDKTLKDLLRAVWNKVYTIATYEIHPWEWLKHNPEVIEPELPKPQMQMDDFYSRLTGNIQILGAAILEAHPEYLPEGAEIGSYIQELAGYWEELIEQRGAEEVFKHNGHENGSGVTRLVLKLAHRYNQEHNLNPSLETIVETPQIPHHTYAIPT